MLFSSYQQAIFNAISTTKDNLMIEAVAGSGKTTTIIEAARYVPSNKQCLFLAFNKNIADELSLRLPSHVKARTLHSLGYSLCQKMLPWFKSNQYKTRNIYQYKCYNWDSLKPAEKKALSFQREDLETYVSLLKAHCVTSPEEYAATLPYIASHYGLDFPTDFFAGDLKKTYQLSLQQKTVIDFDDMIYFPAMLPEPFPFTYDYIFVDEAQDLSPVQAKFLRKLLTTGGRIIFVGDSRQAIYGFRGSDVDSISKLEQEFDCRKLPLSISYRCAKSIVEEARTICPQIESFIQSPLGVVKQSTDYLEHIQKGDFLICRTLLPLRRSLVALVGKNLPINFPYPELLKSLVDITESVKEKHGTCTPDQVRAMGEIICGDLLAHGKKRKAGEIVEKYLLLSTLVTLFPNESNYSQVLNTALTNPDGVRVMTIHKAKGLEANTVYFLNADQIPHEKAIQPWEITQEYNMKYVGITRAKERLIYAQELED